jgi:hypothetical protein
MRVADFRSLRFVKDATPLWGTGEASFCISPRAYDFGGVAGRRLLFSARDPAGELDLCIRQARLAQDGWEVVPGSVLAGGCPGGRRGVTAPDVVRLADGRWRMFCEARDDDAASAVIASAVSSDGSAWSPEAGVRVSAGPYPASSHRDPIGYGTPSCVADPAGGWRLYFHELASSHYHIVSAHSTDGLN